MSGLAVYFMRMKKRPYIPLFILISTLIITVLEHKSPIVEKYGSFKLIFSKDIMDSIMSMPKELYGLVPYVADFV